MPSGKHSNHRRGPDHYRFNADAIVSSHGYIKVRVSKSHHLADPNGYAYEHRLIAERMLGRQLGRSELVHHRNGDRQDNRPDNLEVMLRGAHLHGRQRNANTGRYEKEQEFPTIHERKAS